jgi:hypothetical protein
MRIAGVAPEMTYEDRDSRGGSEIGEVGDAGAPVRCCSDDARSTSRV